MSIQELKAAKKKVVGIKQTLRAIDKNSVTRVFVARDAENRVLSPLLSRCEEQGIPVIWVDTMREIGRACGVDVGAAAAAPME